MKRKTILVIVIFFIIQLFVTGMAFKLSAEIIEKGNNNYIIMNDTICNEYYCGDEGNVIDNKAQMDKVVKAFVDRWGMPAVYISDNKGLDSEVAEITKKHGWSITYTNDFEYIVNVYYKGAFRFYGWR